MAKIAPAGGSLRQPGLIPGSLISCIGSGPLLLDADERRIRGFEMAPLLSGEMALLCYLGSHPETWHSSYQLCMQVYGRDDAGARQLVWKYASTLRKKLARAAPELIDVCRRRGYCCRLPIKLTA
jgi:DNA-binding response OmpR family regulator